MLIESAALWLHGSKLALSPLCRERDTPFTVIEWAQLFSANVSHHTLGKAIVASLAGSRDDVSSNAEGLDLDEFAKLFGERTIGALEKRSGRCAISIIADEYRIHPWLRDGNRGAVPGKVLRTPLTTEPNEIALLCLEQLKVSLEHARTTA
jgi:hypothetical protein